MTSRVCHICHPCISIRTPLVFGRGASSHTLTRHSDLLIMVMTMCRIHTSRPNEGRKGRRKKKRLKGDMDAVRGYSEDMYGGGDFNETCGGNLCSVCKEPGHKASRHRRRGQ
jgi:hypothetical protein